MSTEENVSLLLCRFAQQSLPCTYGNCCRFVHDDVELIRRQTLLQERHNMKARLSRGVCHSFIRVGSCSYGDNCRFAHVDLETASAHQAKTDKKRSRQLQRLRAVAIRSDPSENSGIIAGSFGSAERLQKEMRSCPIYEQYEEVFEEGIQVITKWTERFRSRSDIWARFIKTTDQQISRVVKEFIEAAPVIARVRASVCTLTPSKEKVTIVDLCSGFGFMSMFLSEMLPPEKVCRILLIDNRWSHSALQRDIAGMSPITHCEPVVSRSEESVTNISKNANCDKTPNKSKYISVDHITGHFFDMWPIPLVASKQNFKSSSGVRSMQRALIDRAVIEGDLILLGIHLCGVLSLRAVDLFNNNSDRVRLFALKPCCLPGMTYVQQNHVFCIGKYEFAASTVCSTGKFQSKSHDKERWNGPPRNHLESKFLTWTNNLAQGIELYNSDCDMESNTLNCKIWTKSVEHIALQPVGYQNKYIWAEAQVVARAEPSQSVLCGAVGCAQLPRELKSCGHECCPSSVPTCCTCSDTRPFLDGDFYSCYKDGTGWTNTESRNAGYCPVCNPKNYDAWKLIIEKEREQKMFAKLQQSILDEQKRLLEEDDKRRALAEQDVANEIIRFQYTNGDIYEGHMVAGEKSGWGKLTYSDGAVYEGEWKNDRHEGFGTKDWCDGIVYIGEWKDGMMHGRGKYSMADGTVVEGHFEEDEFAEYL